MDPQVNSLMEGTLSVSTDPQPVTFSAARVESGLPLAYRLIRRNDGNGGQDYVLQGLFTWRQGFSQGGIGGTLKLKLNLTFGTTSPFRVCRCELKPERLSARPSSRS